MSLFQKNLKACNNNQLFPNIFQPAITLDKFLPTFTGHKSMIILGEMLKCTDETLVTSKFYERGNKKSKFE